MIKMVAIALMVMIPAAAAAAPMPWRTFSGMVNASVIVKTAACERGVVGLGVFRGPDNARYEMAYAPSTGRVMFIYEPKPAPGSLPTEVGIGDVNPGNQDLVPEITWSPWPANAGALDVCEVLFPPDDAWEKA